MTDDVSAAGGYPGSGAGAAPDWEAIARYLAGESQPEEASIIEQWLEAHPRDRDLVERLDAEATIEPADVDVEAALASVHARMAGADTSRPRVLSMPPARRPLWQPLTVIGLLAAAAVVGVIVTRQTRTAPDQGAQATLARTYTTGVGQRDSVRLADGSRVVLGPDSRLTVPADYGTGSRSVELRGDGYFDVVHDAAKPFAFYGDKDGALPPGAPSDLREIAGRYQSYALLIADFDAAWKAVEPHLAPALGHLTGKQKNDPELAAFKTSMATVYEKADALRAGLQNGPAEFTLGLNDYTPVDVDQDGFADQIVTQTFTY